MKKVARLRVPQDEFVPPNKSSVDSNVSVRTTGRIKKPKAVFDPSDNYVPRAQRLTQVVVQQQQFVTSPKSVTVQSPTAAVSREKQRERSLSTGSNNASSQETDMCFVCLKREPRRGGNYRNKLLTCISCCQRIHRWCASTDIHDAAPVRQSFKCDNCRTCDVCDKNEKNLKGNADMITCAKCLSSYHVTCHTPKLTKNQLNQRSWKCCKCLPNVAPAVTNNINASKEESMTVTVIRQILGYDTNIQSSPKLETSPQTAVQQLQKCDNPTQEPQQEQNQQPLQKAQDRIITVEVPAQSKEQSRTHLEMSSTSSESNDEDYNYVEKKKRKLMPESNNNNNNGDAIEKRNGSDHDENNCKINDTDVDMETVETDIQAELEQKPILNNLNHNLNDFPKREVIQTWSVEELTSYVQKFFPNEAQVFKEHEIDGNALLLLKRSDVIKKLPLKLGPSLRLYDFILKIQTQKPFDKTLGWDCSIDTLLPSTE